jgi:hypothetical protein
MGNTIILVASHHICHFPSFQSSRSIRVHQGRLVGKRIIEKEPDLIEKTPRRMKISTWWEDLGTQLRTRTKRRDRCQFVLQREISKFTTQQTKYDDDRWGVLLKPLSNDQQYPRMRP